MFNNYALIEHFFVFLCRGKQCCWCYWWFSSECDQLQLVRLRYEQWYKLIKFFRLQWLWIRLDQWQHSCTISSAATLTCSLQGSIMKKRSETLENDNMAITGYINIFPGSFHGRCQLVSLLYEWKPKDDRLIDCGLCVVYL